MHNVWEALPDVRDTLDAWVPRPKGEVLSLENEKPQGLANPQDLFLWLTWLVRYNRSAFNPKEAKAELKHGSGFRSCALVT